jgi:hypothetical protein
MPDTNRSDFGEIVRELRPHALWQGIMLIGSVILASVISPVLLLLRQKFQHAPLDWYFLVFVFITSLLAFTIFAGVVIFLAARSSRNLSVSTSGSSPSSALSNIEIPPVPVHPRHEGDGGAPDVRFWHSVADREAHRRDVRALVSGSARRVIITGIELNYIIKYCANELQTALSGGTLIGIVIAKSTPRNIAFYTRYSRGVAKTLVATHDMYSEFAKSLDKRQSECFALYHTDIALTHSIGLYDDAVYVSEFCIDCPSSLCPSFSPPPGSRSHSLFISELKEILKGSLSVHGSGHARLLGTL